MLILEIFQLLPHETLKYLHTKIYGNWFSKYSVKLLIKCHPQPQLALNEAESFVGKSTTLIKVWEKKAYMQDQRAGGLGLGNIFAF